MNSQQIASFFMRSRIFSNVVFHICQADELMNLAIQFPTVVICNSDTDTRYGRYWHLIYMPNAARAVLFDALGFVDVDVTPFFEMFLRWGVRSVELNHSAIQAGGSFYLCGYYCVYFATHLLAGIPFERVLEEFPYGASERLNDERLWNTISTWV